MSVMLFVRGVAEHLGERLLVDQLAEVSVVRRNPPLLQVLDHSCDSKELGRYVSKFTSLEIQINKLHFWGKSC